MLFIIDCVSRGSSALTQSPARPHHPGETRGRRQEGGGGDRSPSTRGSSTLASSMAGKAQLVAAGGGYRFPSRSWS